MTNGFGYKAGKVTKAFDLDGYYLWDCSVIKSGGKYHMFSSRWEEKRGYGWNWVFNSEIIHAVADKPEGPYEFKNVVLPRRGREYFDGMNTHNTCIKEYDGKFYLYYMGTTYHGDPPERDIDIPERLALETWNRKRIGLAIADDINGEFVRTSDEPIFDFKNDNMALEDPCIWYDDKKKKFCAIMKDDVENGDYGVTGEWGSGFYAESDDCKTFTLEKNPKVYSRTVEWEDGRVTTQGNLERPCVLFDENGEPTHIFCATGDGGKYRFEGRTYIVCIKLEKE